MTYIVERDDTWDITLEIKNVKGVKSVDLTFYYWEKYDEDSGNEIGTESEIQKATINLSDNSLNTDNDHFLYLLNDDLRNIFYVTYGSVDVENQNKLEECISECIYESSDE